MLKKLKVLILNKCIDLFGNKIILMINFKSSCKEKNKAEIELKVANDKVNWKRWLVKPQFKRNNFYI